jgi:hypothetical protein
MISNELRWSSHLQTQRRPFREHPRPADRPAWGDTLATREIQIERKSFLAMVRENTRGRFLRITETAAGKTNTVIVPASGLRDFQRMLEEMAQAAVEPPASPDSPEREFQVEANGAPE